MSCFVQEEELSPDLCAKLPTGTLRKQAGIVAMEVASSRCIERAYVNLCILFVRCNAIQIKLSILTLK